MHCHHTDSSSARQQSAAARTLRVLSFMPRGPSAHSTLSAREAAGCCCCSCCARTGLGAAAMPLALEARLLAAAKGLGACREGGGDARARQWAPPAAMHAAPDACALLWGHNVRGGRPSGAPGPGTAKWARRWASACGWGGARGHVMRCQRLTRCAETRRLLICAHRDIAMFYLGAVRCGLAAGE